MIAVYFGIVTVFRFMGRPADFLVNLMTFVMLSICVACHVVVLWRIPYVAAR